jgi:hypothetical protein
LKIGIILIVIGLVVGLWSKGWITLFIGIGCAITGIILANLPNNYLVSFIKFYDTTITPKEATAIVQKHLQEPKQTDRDTIEFVYRIIDGVERENRLRN